MKRETINKILQQTEQGYDLISEKFSQTRKHFWGELEFIGEYAKVGDKILDYGCGNGRLLELFKGKNINYVGIDASGKLIEFARDKYETMDGVEFLKINPSQTSLPFPDNYFNTIYSIAVFHHLPDKKFRLRIVKEMHRILKPGGYIVVTVWNLWQPKYRKKIWQNWKNKILGKSELDWNDCWIDFTDNKGKKFKRYHHAFAKRELKQLFKQTGFKIEKCEIPDGRNILLVGRLAKK